MAREGVRLTSQALQQMSAPRRLATLVATMRDLEATTTDAALAMFGSLVGRANLRARKRLDETILASADQGRERLVRIAAVLEAMTKALRNDKDVAEAVTSVASIELIEADAQLIRRTTKLQAGWQPLPSNFHIRRSERNSRIADSNSGFGRAWQQLAKAVARRCAAWSY